MHQPRSVSSPRKLAWKVCCFRVRARARAITVLPRRDPVNPAFSVLDLCGIGKNLPNRLDNSNLTDQYWVVNVHGVQTKPNKTAGLIGNWLGDSGGTQQSIGNQMSSQISAMQEADRMSVTKLFRLFAVTIALEAASLSAFGQGIASINGTVVDTSHAAVAHATLTLTNADNGMVRTTASTSTGQFVFPDVSPGNYHFTATATGFKTWVQSRITLSVGQSLTLSPVLQVGTALTQVVVSGGVPLINTSSSNLSAVIDSRSIQQLPLNGRNAIQLVSLAPGVVSTGTQGQFGATQAVYASSGGRDIDVNYTLDGSYNENPFYDIPNNYPNPDALREFAVITRNYSAQFGRGSTDVSAVTRSGTNSIHGSAYEFYRDTALDARPYFSPTTPIFHRNQFGGTIGGPIIKNQLFYFLSYQGTNQSGGPGTQTYPTMSLQERNGDFSDISKPVIDPATGLQFPGNKIPTSLITPQAQKFMSGFLPEPNVGAFTYSFPNIGILNEHQGIARVDYQFTRNDQLFGRYFVDDLPQIAFAGGSGSALASNWISNMPSRFQNTTIGYIHTFTPTLLNDFHFSYVRSAFGVAPLINFSLTGVGYDVNTGSAFTQFGLIPDSSISVSGSFSGYAGAPTRDIMPTTHITDNLSWSVGIQSINLGFELFRNRINETQNFETGGFLSFNGQATGVPNADFLLGDFSSYGQSSGLASRLRQTLPSFYFQDDIKVAPTVTVNAGLRWDIIRGYHSQDGQLMAYEPGQQSTVFPLATRGLLYPGDAGVPNDIIGTQWHDIAPRLGVDWDVRGDGRTSVRLGGGLYYIPLTRGITLNRLTEILPFNLTVSLNAGNANDIWAQAPYNGVDPFGRPPASNRSELEQVVFQEAASENSIQRHFKPESVYEWSVSVQQALWKDAVLETDYVGGSSSHLMTSFQNNWATYIPGHSTEANTQERRLNPEIGPINTIGSNVSSNYNGLEVNFTQRLLHGVSITSSYTWSKALGVAAAEGEGSNGPRDPTDWILDYSPLSFDVTNNSITSFIWQPYSADHLRSALLQNLVGRWQIGGILAMESGTPLTLRSGVDNSFSNIGGDTPDVVGRWQLSGGRSKKSEINEWFNPAAFVTNAVGTFGDLRPGTLRNPGMINFDMALQKNVQLKEGVGLELRGSFYNLFNHTNLSSVNGTLTSATFAQVTNALNPRVIELSARMTF